MKETLTGRARFRLYNGKLVLQVEVEGFYTTNHGGYIDTEQYTEFRDAKVQDISCLSIAEVKGETENMKPLSGLQRFWDSIIRPNVT